MPVHIRVLPGLSLSHTHTQLHVDVQIHPPPGPKSVFHAGDVLCSGTGTAMGTHVAMGTHSHTHPATRTNSLFQKFRFHRREPGPKTAFRGGVTAPAELK